MQVCRSTGRLAVRSLSAQSSSAQHLLWRPFSFSSGSFRDGSPLSVRRRYGGASPLPVCDRKCLLSKVAKRTFSSSPQTCHGHLTPPKPGEEIKISFVDKDGSEHDFAVAKGDNLLDIAQANDLEMEGACGGSCACSTCHIIVEDSAFYDKMPEPDDDENDMLDLAFGLTETSRLGCQIKVSPELDGMKVRLPAMTRNLQASDFGGSSKD